MCAIRQGRLETSHVLVLAAGARLETLQLTLDTGLDARVVADVEMQERALLPGAPVAAEQGPIPEQVERACDRGVAAALARKHDQNALGDAGADLVKELPVQVALPV